MLRNQLLAFSLCANGHPAKDLLSGCPTCVAAKPPLPGNIFGVEAIRFLPPLGLKVVPSWKLISQAHRDLFNLQRW